MSKVLSKYLVFREDSIIEKRKRGTSNCSPAIAKAAQQAGVATQMGNQGMAFKGNRLINEWIWDGAIGPVREVHAWSDRPTYNGRPHQGTSKADSEQP